MCLSHDLSNHFIGPPVSHMIEYVILIGHPVFSKAELASPRSMPATFHLLGGRGPKTETIIITPDLIGREQMLKQQLTTTSLSLR